MSDYCFEPGAGRLNACSVNIAPKAEPSPVTDHIVDIKNINHALSSSTAWNKFAKSVTWLPRSIVQTVKGAWTDAKSHLENVIYEKLISIMQKHVSEVEITLADGKEKLINRITSLLIGRGIEPDKVEDLVETFLLYESGKHQVENVENEIAEYRIKPLPLTEADNEKLNKLEEKRAELTKKRNGYKNTVENLIRKMGMEHAAEIKHAFLAFLKFITRIESGVVTAGVSWSSLSQGWFPSKATFSCQGRVVLKKSGILNMLIRGKKPAALEVDLALTSNVGPGIGIGILEAASVEKKKGNLSARLNFTGIDRFIVKITLKPQPDKAGYFYDGDTGIVVVHEQLLRMIPQTSVTSHGYGVQLSDNAGFSLGKEIFALNEKNFYFNTLMTGAIAAAVGGTGYFLLPPHPDNIINVAAAGGVLGGKCANWLFPGGKSLPATIETFTPGLQAGRLSLEGLTYAVAFRELRKIPLIDPDR